MGQVRVALGRALQIGQHLGSYDGSSHNIAQKSDLVDQPNGRVVRMVARGRADHRNAVKIATRASCSSSRGRPEAALMTRERSERLRAALMTDAMEPAPGRLCQSTRGQGS